MIHRKKSLVRNVLPATAAASGLFLLVGCSATQEPTPADGGAAGMAGTGGSGGTDLGGSAGVAVGAGNGAGGNAAGGSAAGMSNAGSGGSGGGSGGASQGGAGNGGAASGGTGVSGGGASGEAGAAGANGGRSGGGTSGSSGAGGSAGGRGGAGGAGAGGSGMGALCPANALFCDDFEDGNLDGWTKNESGGTLVVTTMQPSHGTRSLQIDVPAMQYGGALIRRGAPLFPLPSARMWGRLMVYFDTIADGHTDIIRGAATNGNTPQYNVGEQHGEILLNYYAGAASDCWARPRPSKVVPLKTWMCWEWSFDGTANQMQFYIDGTLSRQVDGTGDGCLSNPTQTWTAPTFAELRIGEYIAERSNAAQRIYIDDIAVGTQGRIACPGP